VLDLKAKKHKMTCTDTMTIGQLKDDLVDTANVEKLRQSIIYRGRTLADTVILKEAGIVEGQTIHLFVRNIPNPAVASATDTSLRINPPGPSNNNLRAAPPGEAASDYTAVQMPASFLPSIENQQQYGGYNSDREELQMRIQVFQKPFFVCSIASVPSLPPLVPSFLSFLSSLDFPPSFVRSLLPLHGFPSFVSFP
jgi:hypothetical protein